MAFVIGRFQETLATYVTGIAEVPGMGSHVFQKTIPCTENSTTQPAILTSRNGILGYGQQNIITQIITWDTIRCHMQLTYCTVGICNIYDFKWKAQAITMIRKRPSLAQIFK